MFLDPFAALIRIQLTPYTDGGINNECNGTKKYVKTNAEKSPGFSPCYL